MRVLLDECIDWRLSRYIFGHEISTAFRMGWAGFKNGDLLTLASEQFDIFVTMDRNLSHQQDLASLSIAVIVLASKSSRLAHLEPLAAKLLTAIETAEPGSTTLISE